MRESLFRLLKQCTVRIEDDGGRGQGTGFFVAPGLILTCAHVVQAAQARNANVTVFWNARPYEAQVNTYFAEPEPDLALLQLLDPVQHPCVLLSREYAPFDKLYAYGYPENYPYGSSLTAECEGEAGLENHFMMRFKKGLVIPGMSGSPLLNLETCGVCGLIELTWDRYTPLGGRA